MLDESSIVDAAIGKSRTAQATSELNVSPKVLNDTLANELDISRPGFRVFELRSFDWIDPLARTPIARSWMLH